MAEINIEPKKRSSSAWSWIIVVLILAVVGYLLYKYLFEAQPVDAELNDAATTGWLIPVSPEIFTT